MNGRPWALAAADKGGEGGGGINYLLASFPGWSVAPDLKLFLLGGGDE